MELKAFIKFLKEIQKENKNIKVKVWFTTHNQYQEREICEQDFVVSNYDWNTTLIFAPIEKFF